MQEEWRPILDFPNYEVSNLGQVRRNNKIRKPQINKGYYVIAIWKNNKQTNKYIHRLVAETFIPNPDNLPIVDHIDRNVTNNVVSNLRWVTKSENGLNTDRRDKELFGIMFDKRINRFCVNISFGSYLTLEEAKEVRDSILNLPIKALTFEIPYEHR